MNIITNYKKIIDEVYAINKKITLIAVSKTYPLSYLKPLIDFGHLDFGENKVQEALNKWSKTLSEFTNLKLHMLGKIQTNKAHDVVSLFSYVHSLDNDKLALKISIEENNHKKKLFHSHDILNLINLM